MSAKPTRRRRIRPQADVGRFAILLVLVVATIGLLGLVGIPRMESDPSVLTRVATMFLASSILVATVRITRTPERYQRIGTIMIGIAAIGGAISFIVSCTAVIAQIIGIFWVLMVGATPVLVLREVLAVDRVTRQTIIGAITVYLQIGVALTFVVMAIDNWGGFFETTPRSTAYVYFSFVTITTVGYGDLSPYSDVARMVSLAFAVIAQMYLVIVIARLVTMWRPEHDAVSDGDDT